MNVVSDDFGELEGNSIVGSYKLMVAIRPGAVHGVAILQLSVCYWEKCVPEETGRRIVAIISDINMAKTEVSDIHTWFKNRKVYFLYMFTMRKY